MHPYGLYLFAMGLGACASSQAPVPVVGAAGDVAALVGQWDGSYDSPVTGRSGSISFTLAAHGDSAFGNVVMIPVAWSRPLQPWTAPSSQGAALTPPPVLRINFVRVRGDRVSGALAPYADPATGARLFTSFDGRIRGDTIEGTFVTQPDPSARTETGRWKVARRRP